MKEELKDLKQINYFTVKTHNDERFKLHISILQHESEIDMNNSFLFDFLTRGFQIDFDR